MKLYLTPELQAHRRGRFLASLLGISQTSVFGLPKTGFVLMTGEALQASRETQEECAAWVRQPGCSLLLLPPFSDGRIFHFLDWMIELTPSVTESQQGASLAGILGNEMSYRLCGIDGASIDGDYPAEVASHTRYWKSHSNSGLIAATTLPLWSISLLDQAAQVQDFLFNIEQHGGRQSTCLPVEDEAPQAETIYPQDITVLVCCYGFNVASMDALLSKLNDSAVPLVNLAHFDVAQSCYRLKNAGLMNDDGVTELGETHLMESKYWLFATRLREEASS